MVGLIAQPQPYSHCWNIHYRCRHITYAYVEHFIIHNTCFSRTHRPHTHTPHIPCSRLCDAWSDVATSNFRSWTACVMSSLFTASVRKCCSFICFRMARSQNDHCSDLTSKLHSVWEELRHIAAVNMRRHRVSVADST